MKCFFLDNKNILVLFCISLIARFIVLPFSQTVDADAVTRVFIANSLLETPRLITDGIWAPLHFYFNALIMMIIPNQIYGPKILHMIFASLTVFPLYFFTKREFNERGALVVAFAFVFCPIVFRNSFHALSGVPYAFFIACSMNCLSRTFRNEKKLFSALFAGFFITIASGLRYEAWLLIAIFTLLILLKKQWKVLIPFWTSSMIIPLLWMFGNYVRHGDILYGLSGAYNWNVVLSGVNDSVSFLQKINRIFFFPISLLKLYSVLIIFLILGIRETIKKKIFYKEQLIWSIPFIVVLITFIFKAFNGTLFLQHRFSISLMLLSLPFLALFFTSQRGSRWVKFLVILVLLNLPFSFVYKSRQLHAIPLLHSIETEQLVAVLNKHATDNKGLIIDFFGWDKSFYAALRSGFVSTNIFFGPGAKHENVSIKKMEKIILKCPEGIILIKEYSKLDKTFLYHNDIVEIDKSNLKLKIKNEFEVLNLKLYSYRLLSENEINQYKMLNPIIDIRPQKKTKIDYYRSQIMSNETWLSDVEKKAKKKGLSLDSMLTLDAIWLIENEKE